MLKLSHSPLFCKQLSAAIISPRQLLAHRLLWAIIIITIVFELVLIRYWQLSVTIPYPVNTGIIMASCLGISIYCKYIRRDDSLSLFANVLNLLICGEFAITIGSYLGAYWSQPLADKIFIFMDSSLGFDALSYARWLTTFPTLCAMMANAYNSCELQFAVLLLLLLTTQLAHGQRVLIALYCSGLITVIIAALLPSLGPYIFYNIDVRHISNMPAYARMHEPLLVGLLMHTATSLPFPGVGIINFPSFHSVMAVVLMYACLPYRFARMIVIPLNIAILFAIPFIGGHYLADVIAGILVAAMSLYIANALLPADAALLQLKRNRKPQVVPLPPLTES